MSTHRNFNSILTESRAGDGYENILNDVVLTESMDSDGYRYKVRVVRAGRTDSANSQFRYNGMPVMAYKDYPEEVLKKVVNNKLLEGVPVLARGEVEHLKAADSGINNLLGTLSDSFWNDADKGVYAFLNVKRGAGLAEVMRASLKHLWKTTKDIGLSIAAFGKTTVLAESGNYIARVEDIEEFQSVDIVPVGNAGGIIVALVESINSKNIQGGNSMDKKTRERIWRLLLKAGLVKDTDKVDDFKDEQLTELLDKVPDSSTETKVFELTAEQRTKMFNSLKKAGLVKDTDKVEDLKDEQLFALLEKVEVKAPTATEPPPAGQEGDAAVKKAQEILDKAIESEKKTSEAMAKVEEMTAQAEAKEVLAESKLPNIFKNKVRTQFEGMIKTPADVERLKKALKLEQDVLVESNPSMKVHFAEGDTRVELINSQRDKWAAQIDLMVCPQHHRAKLIESNPDRAELYKQLGTNRLSFKEAYIMLTGDSQISGRVDSSKLTEGLVTADWAQIFGDSMRRTMMLEYSSLIDYDDWKKIANIGETPDFRAKKYIELGGYSDLPTVNEDDDFVETTSPSDHEVENTAATKGYIDRITRRMVINDDLNALRLIPLKMARAAKRTLYKAVFNPIINNSAIYDGKLLLHADHSNRIADALGEDGIAFGNAMQLLKDQVEKDSGEKLGIRGKFLIIPSTVAMRKAAYAVTTPGFKLSNNVPEWHQTWQVEPIEVVHWGSQTDWRVMASPQENPTVQVDFLQGKQEPEMFVSDSIASDTFFVKERIRYKLRHEYGVAVLSYKTIAGSIA